MIFFDTNLIVAATLPTHSHHTSAHACLAEIRKVGGACAAHSLAEAYAVFTRIPLPYRLSPSDAWSVVDDIASFAVLISLDPGEARQAIRSLAERNLGGGLVYDALLLACARKVNASTIYTHDVGHFRQVAPDLANRFRIP